MKRIRIALPAQAELSAILATSLARWGEEGRRRYASLLEATLRTIAEQPMGALTRDRSDVRSGYRSLHARHFRAAHGVRHPVHVVYFRTTPAAVVILAVLHERMDAQARLGPRRKR